MSLLKGDQPKAFDAIKMFIGQPTGGMFLLDGYAGTGKTYLMNIVIKHLQLNTKLPILVTAPTHKAVKVLRQHITESVDYSTVHSALGLREEIDGYGKQHFKRDPRADCKLYQYQFLIIDEVSMLPDEIYEELQTFIKRGLRVLFVGDSMQIPPVNMADSLPFDRDTQRADDIGYVRMEEIIRQAAGNPIIENSFQIRQFIHRPIPIINRVDQSTIQGSLSFVDDKSWRSLLKETILPMYKSPEFKTNPDHVKILAWRNKTVNSYNKVIREAIYGQVDLARILPGDKLIANEPILDGKIVIINNNEEMEVLGHTIKEHDLGESQLKYYNAHVNVYREGIYTEFYIKILHEDSQQEYDTILNLQKQFALSKKQGSFHAREAWVDYYGFKRIFADVKYNYAITCHKSQGSTYKNVVVLEQDIDRNSKTYEKNRVFYTACTRPSENLYIVY